MATDASTMTDVTFESLVKEKAFRPTMVKKRYTKFTMVNQICFLFKTLLQCLGDSSVSIKHLVGNR